MPRTALPVTNLAPNAGLTLPAGASGESDGHYIDTNARTGVTDVALPELLLIAVTSVDEATGDLTVTVGAGDYPPALAAGQGPLEVDIEPGETALIGPFESGRFLGNDGHVNIDYSHTGRVGGVVALRFPRNT